MEVLCVVSTITCIVSPTNRMLEFVVMVAAHKIVYGCITFMVLYCLGMRWVKTVTAKFQYLGALHYQFWKPCVHLYVGFTTTLHPVYRLKAVAAHIVCPLSGRNQSPSEPQNQVNWNDTRFWFFFPPLQTTSCSMHYKTEVTKFSSCVESLLGGGLWLSLHNICDCLATGSLIWADVSRRAAASNPNIRCTLPILEAAIVKQTLTGIQLTAIMCVPYV